MNFLKAAPVLVLCSIVLSLAILFLPPLVPKRKVVLSAIVFEAEPYEGQVMTGNHLGAWRNPQSFCIYSERSSGSNFLESLVKANFLLPLAENCPWKHEISDLARSNPFSDLGEDTLVFAIVRNALDWVGSLYKQPYYAPHHCNVTLEQFLTWPWAPGKTRSGGPLSNETYCHKTQSSHQEYEQKQGRYASSVLELRKWKLTRIRRLCSTRRQAACVRYEDLVADPEHFFDGVRDRFHLKTKPGYFHQVTSYKGIDRAPEYANFQPSSEAQRLRDGFASMLWNTSTLALLRQGLDLKFEAGFPYFYDDIFRLYGLSAA